jgi:hypothetical protein
LGQIQASRDGLSLSAQGRQPVLFNQFKNAHIVAAVVFHRALQQTVGLGAHPLRVCPS